MRPTFSAYQPSLEVRLVVEKLADAPPARAPLLPESAMEGGQNLRSRWRAQLPARNGPGVFIFVAMRGRAMLERRLAEARSRNSDDAHEATRRCLGGAPSCQQA